MFWIILLAIIVAVILFYDYKSGLIALILFGIFWLIIAAPWILLFIIPVSLIFYYRKNKLNAKLPS